DVVVVLVVDVVVELVEVVVTGQLGSPGCPVQVHIPALHWSRIDDLQALRAAPDKPAHPAAISSAHAFEPQIEGAALAPETKTPAPSATAAIVTPALLVIVAPRWPFPAKLEFRRSTAAYRRPTRLSTGKVPRDAGDGKHAYFPLYAGSGTGRRPPSLTSMTRHRTPGRYAARAASSVGCARCTSSHAHVRASYSWTL